MVPLYIRFWKCVERHENGCWLWKASTDSNGYGHLRIQGRLHQAHRISYLLVYGPIGDDVCVLHKCDNPPCVRPDHLFPGSKTDNALDMIAKGRDNRETGDQHWQRRMPGRLRGSRNGRAKFTEDQVVAIRAEYQSGTSSGVLATRFNVARSVIEKIVSGRSWKHAGGIVFPGGRKAALELEDGQLIASNGAQH